VGAGGRWTCDGCGASWGSAARFCGACGSGATSGQPAVPRRARTAGRARRAAAAVGALVLLGGLAVVTLSWPWSAPARTGAQAGLGSDEVALPQPRDLPSPDPEDTEPEDEAGPAPDELRMWYEVSCGGDDCERWRRPFDDVPVWGAWRDAAEVLFVTGDRLVAWDAETGEDRWQRSVPSDVALGPQEMDGGAWRPLGVTGDDSWLVVTGPGGVQLLTRSGEERWTARFTDGETPFVAVVAGEVVLVVTEADWPPAPAIEEDASVEPDPDPTGDPEEDVPLDPGEDAPPDPEEDAPPEPDEDDPVFDEPELSVVAFELATGDVRWRREGFPLIFPPTFGDLAQDDQDDVLLVQEDRAVVAVELADGAERYRLEDASGAGAIRVGSFVVRDGPAVDRPAQVAIHAADDGRELAVFPDRRLEAALPVDDHLVAVLHPASDEDENAAEPLPGTEAVALDLAGAIAWRAPLAPGATTSCCASVLEAGPGVVRVAAGPDVAATHLDVRSGRVVGREPAAEAARDEWPLGRDVAVSHASSGQQTTIRRGQGGQPVTVMGGFAQPVLGRDGRAAWDGWLLLRVETGLVAVELPTPSG
jgi:hypothetical protein